MSDITWPKVLDAKSRCTDDEIREMLSLLVDLLIVETSARRAVPKDVAEHAVRVYDGLQDGMEVPDYQIEHMRQALVAVAPRIAEAMAQGLSGNTPG